VVDLNELLLKCRLEDTEMSQKDLLGIMWTDRLLQRDMNILPTFLQFLLTLYSRTANEK